MATPEEIWAQAQLDPAYLAGHGSNTKSLIDAILGYGNSSALSPELAARYGIQPGQVSAADQNPYSTQAQLAQQLSGDQYGITNNANAHGALFSGAHAAAQQHELGNAGQRNYNAHQALAQQISGINANDTNALTGAYGTLTNNALNTPVPAPAAPPAAVYTPETQAAVLPTAAQIPGATNATANWNDNPGGYNPVAPQNGGLATIKPPKLPKLSTGYLGHA